MPFGHHATAETVAQQASAELESRGAWQHIAGGRPWTWHEAAPADAPVGFVLKSEGSSRVAACSAWARDAGAAASGVAAAIRDAIAAGDGDGAARIATEVAPCVVLLESLFLRATPVAGGAASEAVGRLSAAATAALSRGGGAELAAPVEAADKPPGAAEGALGADGPAEAVGPAAVSPGGSLRGVAVAPSLAAARAGTASLLRSLRQPAARLGRTSVLLPHVIAFVVGSAVPAAAGVDPDAAPLLLLDALALTARVADSHRPWLGLLGAGALLGLALGCPRPLAHHRALAFEVLSSVRAGPTPLTRLVSACAAQAATDACFGDPPSAGHDAELDACLRESLTATSLPLQRSAALALCGALARGGCHSSRVLGDVVTVASRWACDSPDAGVVVASLASCRVAAVSCWPRVRDHEATAAALVAAAVTAAAQSGALPRGANTGHDRSHGEEDSSPASPGGAALGPAARAVVEEALLLLAVVARARGPGAAREMVEAALGRAGGGGGATGPALPSGARWVASAVGVSV